MALQVNLTYSHSNGGAGFGESIVVPGDDVIEKKKLVDEALDGELTTRTDSDTGEISFDDDPGLVVGQRVDVFWNIGGVPGCRRGMKVSSIAGSGPYLATVGTAGGDTGAGDNLPSLGSAVAVGVPEASELLLTGNIVLSLLATAGYQAVIVITDVSNVELWSAVLTGVNKVKAWYTGNGDVNPVAGVSLSKVYMSHGDITSAQQCRLCVQTNQ